MKLVLDNIIFWLQKSGGISVLWRELINKSKDDFVPFYINQSKIPNNIFYPKDIIAKHSVIIEKDNKLNRLLPVKFESDEKFIFHSSYYRYCKSNNAINVTTVHDFTHEYFFKGYKRVFNKYLKKRALKNSHGIVCISDNTKKDLLHFYPWVIKKKITVIYNGVSDEFKSIHNAKELNTGILPDVKSKYVLFIGSRANYKNFDKAVETIQKLNNTYKLLIVGAKLSDIERLDLDSKIENRYIELGNVDNEKLNLIYNLSFCLLYPSSYEGFGIPVVEAMKAGCPVVATNNSSLPEVASNCAILVKNVDAGLYKSAIESLEIIGFRNEMIQKGLKRSREFSWDKNYQEIKEFYSELANSL